MDGLELRQRVGLRLRVAVVGARSLPDEHDEESSVEPAGGHFGQIHLQIGRQRIDVGRCIVERDVDVRVEGDDRQRCGRGRSGLGRALAAALQCCGERSAGECRESRGRHRLYRAGAGSVSAIWCLVATGRIVALATSAIASSPAIKYIATL